ncbi:hypothetical protein AVEN_35410-1 [Araneus ventricosus]|uniref:Uncharacterized protein n=1 Tax=Araneus ventricosus TaxID=182803 RepID=A0A4Y2N7P6_ARAVE|nr:hypothetical protein AVEN_35410-1 [Araneus ventricosus]
MCIQDFVCYVISLLGPIHDGSSVESGFEPGTLRFRSRDLTTWPPRPRWHSGVAVTSIRSAHAPLASQTLRQATKETLALEVKVGNPLYPYSDQYLVVYTFWTSSAVHILDIQWSIQYCTHSGHPVEYPVLYTFWTSSGVSSIVHILDIQWSIQYCTHSGHPVEYPVLYTFWIPSGVSSGVHILDIQWSNHSGQSSGIHAKIHPGHPVRVQYCATSDYGGPVVCHIPDIMEYPKVLHTWTSGGVSTEVQIPDIEWFIHFGIIERCTTRHGGKRHSDIEWWYTFRTSS